MNPAARLALAPTDLTYTRATRDDGAGFSVLQSRFAPADVELMGRVYRMLRRAHGLWLHLRDATRGGAPLHIDLLRRHLLRELRDRRFLMVLRGLGSATYDLGVPDRDVRGALHDIRGGALLALIGFAAAEARGEMISDAEIRHVALRARDHARIMRQCVIDLDPQLREIDAEIKTHIAYDFVDKWNRSIYRAGERRVDITCSVDFAGMVAEIAFPDARPRFYFLNLGETHYPYMLSGENLPHISGVHGVLKHLDSGAAAPDAGEQVFFPPDEMQRLHRQQVKCVEYLDGLLGALYAKCPANTHFIVTADHGELFGEEGYFGHGPIMHEKCFEVPFVEGLRP